MGVGRRLIQRRHKLRKDVQDNVPGRELVEKMDITLNDQPGSYSLVRKNRRRQDRNFGIDSLDRKLEVAWEIDVVIDRHDFGGSDFGLRVTLPSSSQLLARGFKPGDELRILEKNSKIANQRYNAVAETNSGDVAAGKVRIVSDTVWRLPKNATIAAVKAHGLLELDSTLLGSDLNDGETLTLNDGAHAVTVFEFDNDSSVTLGNIAVPFTNGDDAATIQASLVAAINGVGAGLAITASPSFNGSLYIVDLLNDTAGTLGNHTTTTTVASSKFSVTGMSGGAAASSSWATESSDRVRVEIGAGVRNKI